MSILNDTQIRHAAERGMLYPFIPHLVRSHKPGYRVVSYGLTSFGYDLRLSDADFCVFSPITGRDIDVKEFNADALIQPPLHDTTDGSGGAYFLLPPHTYALGVTVETITMPDNLVSICLGKSTYARAGLIVNTTPMEPGWRGRLVLEFSNSADLPIKLYANEGICQAMFFEGERPETTYGDRGGKYQNQTGLTLAKV